MSEGGPNEPPPSWCRSLRLSAAAASAVPASALVASRPTAGAASPPGRWAIGGRSPLRRARSLTTRARPPRRWRGRPPSLDGRWPPLVVAYNGAAVVASRHLDPPCPIRMRGVPCVVHAGRLCCSSLAILRRRLARIPRGSVGTVHALLCVRLVPPRLARCPPSSGVRPLPSNSRVCVLNCRASRLAAG